MGYKKEKRVCEYCGKEFLGIKTRKYCSKECSHNARKKQKEIICIECGKHFSVQEYRDAKFCSQECKIKHQTTELANVKCTNCGKEFKRKPSKINENNFCCKKCADEYNKGENHYEWKDYLHIEGRKDALRKWGKSVKKRDNYVCQKCGSTDKSIIQAHHIIPKSKDHSCEFDESNGISLCIYCHYKEHEGDINAQRLIKEYINNYELNNTTTKCCETL